MVVWVLVCVVDVLGCMVEGCGGLWSGLVVNFEWMWFFLYLECGDLVVGVEVFV